MSLTAIASMHLITMAIHQINDSRESSRELRSRGSQSSLGENDSGSNLENQASKTLISLSAVVLGLLPFETE